MKTFYQKPAFAFIVAAMFIANFAFVPAGYADEEYFYCSAASADSEKGFVTAVLSTSDYRQYIFANDFSGYLESEYGVDISSSVCYNFPGRELNVIQMRRARDFYRRDLDYSVKRISEYEWNGE